MWAQQSCRVPAATDFHVYYIALHNRARLPCPNDSPAGGKKWPNVLIGRTARYIRASRVKALPFTTRESSDTVPGGRLDQPVS